MTPTQLDITIEEQEGITVAHVKGPIDSATMDHFHKTFGALFRARNAKVVMDCTDLTYINSRGMGWLMEYHRQVTLGKGRLVLANPLPMILFSFQRLKLTDVIKTYPSVADALAALH